MEVVRLLVVILIPWIWTIAGFDHEIFEGAEDVLTGVDRIEGPEVNLAAHGKQQCDDFHGLSFVTGLSVPGFGKKSPDWNTGLRSGTRKFPNREKRLENSEAYDMKGTVHKRRPETGDRRPDMASS